MTILQMGLARHRDLFLKSVLPLGLSFAATISFPAKIKTQQIILIKHPLVIQTSKMDPPRIAFDEVNQQQRSQSTQDWAVAQSKKGIALQSGAANLWRTSPKDILRVRRVHLPEMVFTENDVSQYLQEQRWYSNLSPAENQRIALANEKFSTLEEDWSNPTLEEATTKSLQEIAKEDVHLQKKIIDQRKSQLLNGQIELQGGLPAGPHWSIEVSRYQDNIKKEDAKIDTGKSNFEIPLSDFSGSLQAKLKDNRTGQVIGEGSYRLSQDMSDHKTLPKIVIKKTQNEVAVNWDSFYRNASRLSGESGSGKTSVAANVLFASINSEGQTDANGIYKFDQVRSGSIGIIRTQANSFYPGMNTIKAGQAKSYPLFPEKMIKALKEIIRDQAVTSEYAETGSVVWGQVLKDGKPVSGVEINVEGLPSYKVSYLNSLLIPDEKQKSTGENGYFVILDLPAGFHSLMATRGNMYLSHVNTIVDDETISTAEIVVNDVRNKTDLKVFDAFTGSPQQASVEIQSLPEAVHVLGFAEVMLPAIDRMSFMNVTPDSQSYLKIMMSYDDNQDFIHVPLIPSVWIQNIIIQRKVNLFPDRGMIIGFVENDNYEVYLGYDSKFPRENIVYFDPQGRISAEAKAGGGFIIFNVNMGPQSVVLAEKDSEMIHMQILDVNSEATSVVKF